MAVFAVTVYSVFTNLQRMNFRGKFNEMNGKKDAIYQCISHYNHNGSDTKIKKIQPKETYEYFNN